MKTLMMAVVLLLLSGCAGMGASMNDAMFPGASVFNNDFDNSTIVRQPPVLASRPTLTSDDTPHLIGFEWVSSSPDTVYISAGEYGEIKNVYSVAFMADDQLVQGVNAASVNTVFDGGNSVRRFSLPLETFRKIASAHIVKMKVGRENDSTVSRFGQDYPDVVASGKIIKFLAKVDEQRTSVKKP